ncbi:hypothetical protein ACVIIV_003203 [Bradyrhizobium sp. USDA 4354]
MSVLSIKLVALLRGCFGYPALRRSRCALDARRRCSQFQRRTRAAHGHNAIALASCSAEVRAEIGLPAKVSRAPDGAVWCRPHTVNEWRNPFIANRLEGPYDEVRTGRPRTVHDEAIAETGHQDTRSQAQSGNPSGRARNRLSDGNCQKHDSSPVPTLRSAASPYPQLQTLDRSFFVEKVRDIIGLYILTRPWCFAS